MSQDVLGAKTLSQNVLGTKTLVSVSADEGPCIVSRASRPPKPEAERLARETSPCSWNTASAHIHLRLLHTYVRTYVTLPTCRHTWQSVN